MHTIVFDVETKNTFEDVGKRDPTLLDISLLVLHDSNQDEYHTFLEDEFDDLWPKLEQADALVGYNSDHFDIPLLNKYYHGDLSQMKSIDLMKDIERSLGRRIGLDDVAEATLGVGKSADGLQAISWWKQGEIEKIQKYCKQDVEVTKDLFEYMQDNEAVKYPDGDEVIELDIDTSEWEKQDNGGMTQSLGF